MSYPLEVCSGDLRSDKRYRASSIEPRNSLPRPLVIASFAFDMQFLSDLFHLSRAKAVIISRQHVLGHIGQNRLKPPKTTRPMNMAKKAVSVTCILRSI